MQTFTASGFEWTGSRNLQEAIDYAKEQALRFVVGLTGPGSLLWYIPQDDDRGLLIYWQRSCFCCEHCSRLIKEDHSGYEVWCEAQSEVIADVEDPRELEKIAVSCSLFVGKGG